MRADIINPSGHPVADAWYQASCAVIALAIGVFLVWGLAPDVRGWVGRRIEARRTAKAERQHEIQTARGERDNGIISSGSAGGPR